EAGLLIVDMLNDFDFRQGDALLRHAEPAAEVIGRLRDEADAAGLPVIYVNDNYGLWHGDADSIVEHCLKASPQARPILERLRPRRKDYLVVKPEFSGFYATTLSALLPRLGVTRLLLTGAAADICVLFTAADAHMREYELRVPADAVASTDPERRDWALDIMAKSMSADTRPTGELSLADWVARDRR
ncbi:MAG TPA: isochorismatase family cysteine hydrolase, partial [Sphingomonas sp.]|nr:isochorismatase family cysteine hydrolase [Sphingomonas sp.]